MKWKELMKTKRLVSLSSVAVTLATVFVLHAMIDTTTTPTSPGTPMPALPTGGSDVLQPFGATGSETPAGRFTANPLPGNCQAGQGLRGTASETLRDDGSPPTQLADNFDVHSNPATIAEIDAVGLGSDGTGSDTPPHDFTAILLANHAYPKYDYDFQAMESRAGVGLGPESTAPDTYSGSANAPPSHAPEPASMLLLGSALIGVAVFARKLKKVKKTPIPPS